jgi:hypothetical protein
VNTLITCLGRRKKREVIEIMDDDEDEVLTLANSSGYIKAPARKRAS